MIFAGTQGSPRISQPRILHCVDSYDVRELAKPAAEDRLPVVVAFDPLKTLLQGGGDRTEFRMINSHNLKSLESQLRVSNPRTMAGLHLNMSFESSKLEGLGPFFPA